MLKKIFPRFIFILLILSSVFNLGRVLFFDTYSSLYLFWNLFLAIIPYFISLYLVLNTKQKILPFFMVVFFVVWLLFLPNAPYLVTDLIHLDDSFIVPRWYDAIILFSYAFLGLFLFFYSIFNMKNVLERKIASVSKINIFIYSTILLSSFGMYLGRSKSLRFNSWEVLSRPNHVFSNIFDIFIHPSKHPQAYIFTLVSFVLLSVSYYFWMNYKK